MRMHLNYLALARVNNGPDGPRAPQRHVNSRPPEHENGRPGARRRELVGIGVLIAAIVVMLWSNSLVVLAVGSLMAALLLCAGFLLITWRRSR